jgi:hypothetical protein
MTKINFDAWKCRSHALGNIMTEGKASITPKQLKQIAVFQGKPKLTDKQSAELDRLIKKRDNPELSTTCKSYLIECYTSIVYGRDKDVYSKFMEKGLMVEEDALTLYSLVKDQFFKKNNEQLENAYVTGCPDIRERNHVRDIKSSWDVHTFIASKVAKINSAYDWQLNSYMWLDNAESGTLAYCLIDTPENLIQKQANQLMWNMGAATNQSPEFLEAKAALESVHKFEDIAQQERVHEKFVRRDDKKINQIPDRVKECREWLNELHYNLTERVGVSLQEVEF